MSKNIGVLFRREENGESKWFENGDEDNDEKYIGEIENGKPNGQGTYTFPDGKKYEGKFKDGKEHGKGTLTTPDGFTDVGDWDDDDLYINVKMDMKLDFEVFSYPNGSKYFGEWKDDKEWNGTSYDKNGNIEWKYVNGKRIKQ